MTTDATSGSASVCDAVALTPLVSLKSYEEPDAIGVARIARSMTDTGVLLDPIVIDRQRGLLIDGHHRCAALGQLGIRQVAAFSTDYFSSSVEVRGWVRVSDVPAVEMERAFSLDTEDEDGDGDVDVDKDEDGDRDGDGDGDVDGQWRVVAVDADEHTLAARGFSRASAATAFLQSLCTRLQARGWHVDLEAAGALPRTQSQTSLRFFVTPVVGKSEVWEAAQRGAPFPNEVNRHLIYGRPVALGIPLDRLHDQARFTDWLRARLGSPERTVVRRGGTFVNGRYYEETVVTPADDLTPPFTHSHHPPTG